MKASELRIGNYIQIRVFEDEMITGKVRIQTLISMLLNESEHLPIPITKEWLENFGFKNIDGVFHKEQMDVFIYKKYSNVIFNGIRFADGIKLKYVHQLQNLYFALTSEELTLTD